MLNILPAQEKKKNLTEYRMRLGVVAVFAVASLILASLVLLAPSYLLAVTKYNNISEQLAQKKSKANLTGQEKAIDVQVRTINKNIDLYLKSGATDKLSPPDVIAEVIELKSAAIKITGFDYDASGPQERLVISGVAEDRDSLAAFVGVLKKSTLFTTVDLPVSSYVKSANITFSIVASHGQPVAAPTKK